MSRSPESLSDVIDRILAFRDERGWKKYHTPDHLSRALSIEAAELEEVFLWREQSADSQDYLDTEPRKTAIRDEIADVLIYALLFCERTGIDPLEAIGSKLEKNREKYPTD